MKNRDYIIDLSALIMAFIGFYPPAPSAHEPAAGVYECIARMRAVRARVQGVSKVYFLVAAGGRALFLPYETTARTYRCMRSQVYFAPRSAILTISSRGVKIDI
jgi:hypothetical protein